MKIDLDTLELALQRILSHARDSRGQIIDVPEDLYWFVPKASLTDPTASPAELTLGSLESDWEQLQRVARGERVPLGYDLVWASAVLRCLGDQVV